MKRGYLKTGIMATLLLSGASAMGQERLEESLYVEGEYVPTVVRQDKIHVLPRKVSFDMPVVQPGADTQLLTGDYKPVFLTLASPVWRGEIASYPWRGYLNVALGSYLNSNLSAGYRVVDSEKTRADVWLQHNSTSLMQPHMGDYFRTWKRYRYDERLGVNVRHDAGRSGMFEIGLEGHLGFFNYYGYHEREITTVSSAEKNSSKAPSQTLTDISLNMGWQSAAKGSMRYGLHAHGGYFGYRRNYTVFDYEVQPWRGQNETEAGISGSLSYGIDEKQTLGVDVDFTNLSYNKAISEGRSRSLQTVSVSPSYRYIWDRVSAKIGLEADLTWGAGKGLGDMIADLDYSTVHVAPMVNLAYDGGRWGAELSFTGGQHLQTLRSGYELDYYQQPLLDFVMPAFVPVEGKLRVAMQGDSPFKAGIDVTYKSIRHLYFGGWYMSELSGYMMDAGDYDSMYGNLSGISLGVDAEWHPVEILKLRGRGTYQPQKNLSTTGFFNGYDRPRWTLDASATLRPVSALNLTLGYRYRGVRGIYKRYGALDDLYRTHLPDICNLNFSARYRLNRSVTFFGSADNLLSRRVELLPCQPTEGFNFILGADVIF